MGSHRRAAERKKQDMDALYKTEIVAVLLLVIFVLSGNVGPITGFVHDYEKDRMLLVINQSGVYELNISHPLKLLAVSGSVAGGAAYIWLDNGIEKRKVWTNAVDSSYSMRGAQRITWMGNGESVDIFHSIPASSLLYETQIPDINMPYFTYREGIFSDGCIETCLIPEDFRTGTYKLVFQLEPDSILVIDYILVSD